MIGSKCHRGGRHGHWRPPAPEGRNTASSTAGQVSRLCGQEHRRSRRRPTRPPRSPAVRRAHQAAASCRPPPTRDCRRPGLFWPGSQVWHISRERLLLLGGPAAVLLQFAHPLIAAGVAAHSSFQDDPLGRLRAVLNITLTVVFGDRQQALAAAVRVGEVHWRVQGRLPGRLRVLPAGSRYRASDPQLALWVPATLVMVALEVVGQFVSPLGSQQRTGYYQQSKPFARLFGVTEQLLPDDYEGFQAYLRRMLHGPELAVDQTAQELATAVLDGWLDRIQRPAPAAARAPRRARPGAEALAEVDWADRPRQPAQRPLVAHHHLARRPLPFTMESPTTARSGACRPGHP